MKTIYVCIYIQIVKAHYVYGHTGNKNPYFLYVFIQVEDLYACVHTGYEDLLCICVCAHAGCS